MGGKAAGPSWVTETEGQPIRIAKVQGLGSAETRFSIPSHLPWGRLDDPLDDAKARTGERKRQVQFVGRAAGSGRSGSARPERL